MMKLAQRVTRIKPSATLAINAKAKALKEQGAHIVNFGVGEPDFDTPQYIQEAAVRAMREGQTRYTAVGGIDQLKDAIIEDLREHYRLDYRRENVLVSCGGKHALYNLFETTIESGDEVIIPAPVLGFVSRHGRAERRRPRIRALSGGKRLQNAARTTGAGHYSEYPTAHL